MKNKLLQLIQYHQKIHKYVEIQDIYKMIFQGVMGAEHIIKDPDQARTRLLEEWQRCNTDNEEVLTEPVSINDTIIRVNLRPLKAKGDYFSSFFDAFIKSADIHQGNRTELISLWEMFKLLCKEKALSFSQSLLKEFDEQLKSQNYPAKHHSQLYREANKPAYRIVNKTIFEQYVLTL